jgi:hypothetical protein
VRVLASRACRTTAYVGVRGHIESAFLLAEGGVPMTAEPNQERLVSLPQGKARLSRQQAAAVGALPLAREPAFAMARPSARELS